LYDYDGLCPYAERLDWSAGSIYAVSGAVADGGGRRSV
jgi:hypothetical protein